jgi:hypothetical protein
VSGQTIAVRCPKCGAKPGQPCVTSGGVVRFDYPHVARAKLYRASRQ